MKKLCLLFILVLVISNLSAQDIIITTHPVSLSQCNGEPASIFVNAESKSGGKLFYQWFKDGNKLFEEVLPVLKFQSLNHNHSGSYYCRVTSEGTSESVDSRSASVYVLRPTSISKEPVDVRFGTFDGNVYLNFEAHINGISVEEAIKKGEYVKIQWYRINGNNHIPLDNDNIFSGTKTNRLSINLNTLPDTTKYFATIEGKCGTVSTRTALVIKNLLEIELKLEIEDLEVCEGTVQSLKASINNPQNHKLEFHWLKNGKPLYFKPNLKGVYSDELVFNPISVEDSGNYSLEVKIKDLNYKTSSNSVNAIIGSKPKIACVRIDTAMKDFHDWTTYYIGFNIFFENNAVPIQFELYENGNIIASYLSTDSKWSVGNIFIIQDYFKRNDTSKYWVIASNKCGQEISDTIMTKTQSFCDPFNQFQLNICENDAVTLEINYNGELSSAAIYEWHFDYKTGGMMVPTPKYDFINSTEFTKNKVIFHKINKRYVNGKIFFDYNLKTASLEIWENNRKVGIDSFRRFYIKIKYLPLITKQPENKTFSSGEKDTLFKVIFDNEVQEDIHITLFYLKTLDSKPKEIEKNLAEYGMWYRYIKDVTFSDEGYYFARISNSPCDTISTDTIKVTIIPKGVVSGVNEIKSAISIYPNPTSDFINISIDSDADLLTREVQILNLLGLVVSKQELRDGNNRIDISTLPRGTYFIKIGDKVEKFVKM